MTHITVYQCKSTQQNEETDMSATAECYQEAATLLIAGTHPQIRNRMLVALAVMRRNDFDADLEAADKAIIEGRPAVWPRTTYHDQFTSTLAMSLHERGNMVDAIAECLPDTRFDREERIRHAMQNLIPLNRHGAEQIAIGYSMIGERVEVDEIWSRLAAEFARDGQ